MKKTTKLKLQLSKVTVRKLITDHRLQDVQGGRAQLIWTDNDTCTCRCNETNTCG